jgi:homeobox protein cut-like
MSAAKAGDGDSEPFLRQVDDLRHQVRALQAVAGYGAPADGDDGAGGGDDEGARLGRGASLEALLVDKARRLEHELTMARLQVAEAQGGL